MQVGSFTQNHHISCTSMNMITSLTPHLKAENWVWRWQNLEILCTPLLDSGEKLARWRGWVDGWKDLKKKSFLELGCQSLNGSKRACLTLIDPDYPARLLPIDTSYLEIRRQPRFYSKARYRVFIKYCVFSKNFQYFATCTELQLAVLKIISQ